MSNNIENSMIKSYEKRFGNGARIGLKENNEIVMEPNEGARYGIRNLEGMTAKETIDFFVKVNEVIEYVGRRDYELEQASKRKIAGLERQIRVLKGEEAW